MDEQQEIQALARVLKMHEVEEETAVTISLLVDKPAQRAALMSWLKKYPNATEPEICRKAKKMARVENA